MPLGIDIYINIDSVLDTLKGIEVDIRRIEHKLANPRLRPETRRRLRQRVCELYEAQEVLMSLAEMSEEREGDEAPFLVDVYDEYISEEFVLNGDPVEYETVIDGQRHSTLHLLPKRWSFSYICFGTL